MSIPTIISLELVTVPEVKPDWIIRDAGNLDARRLIPSHIFDRPSMALFEQLQAGAEGDFAVVDLGHGEEWATTRLFIFAVVLERLRQRRCFVFLEANKNEWGRRQWLGVATPEGVHRALADHYPWLATALEAALAAAEAPPAVLPPSPGSPDVEPDPKKTEREATRKLVQYFLGHNEIQRYGERPGDGWLPVEAPQSAHEHGEWLTSDLLVRNLGKALDQDSWVTETDPAATERAILRRTSLFVGVVRDGGWFVRLVDRNALVERVVEQVAIDEG